MKQVKRGREFELSSSSGNLIVQFLWKFRRNRDQKRRRIQLVELTDVFRPYTPLSLLSPLWKMSGDCCWWEFRVNVKKCAFWEYLSISHYERCFGKSRKCCWCKIWLYWVYCVLYMDAVLLMRILRFLNLKWINFRPYLPYPSPLPILASCEGIRE